MTANSFSLTGPDLVCLADLDPLGTETTTEAQNLAQDCLHWLLCLPGGNLDDLDRGVGVMQYLSGTTEDAIGLPSAIQADFEKDTRVVNSVATLERQSDGSYLISVEVQPIAGAVLPLAFGYAQGGGLVLL